VDKETILILGASSDLGRELLKQIDAPGLVILAHGHQGLAKIEAMQPFKAELRLIQADLGNREGVNDFVKQVMGQGLNITRVVLMATPKVEHMRFKECQWDDFLAHLQVQLCPAVEVLSALLPGMVKAGKGKVVFVLSSVTLSVPCSALAPYATAKQAVLGLMRALASEYAGKNIQFNAISPSMIKTEGLSLVNPRVVELSGEAHPMGRLACPKDIVPLIVFLLSSGSDYMNGSNIPVTGGQAY
jgi:3-oxoacyl-[acyl-carrier protein] reductase